jgi:hypothetical protein
MRPNRKRHRPVTYDWTDVDKTLTMLDAVSADLAQLSSVLRSKTNREKHVFSLNNFDVYENMRNRCNFAREFLHMMGGLSKEALVLPRNLFGIDPQPYNFKTLKQEVIHG